ncbi:MAG: LLM class F420-dependent oxidoreductase [Myxococcota bacterium]
MKIGIATAAGPHTLPDFLAEMGRVAESRGFHSLWVPEHVIFFQEHASRYPYSEDGRIPGNPTGAIEPFLALGWLAAHTERIRLGTGICLVPQRAPIYTAKQVADLDFLSGGRVDFGVGIGWLREEFAALGVPWERRAARTRECVAVMKTLWCDEVSSFQGEFYSLPHCLQNPKPIQNPHPPIHFGGESDAALRRAAEIGQGWYGFQLSPDDACERIRRLGEILAESGRELSALHISVGAPSRRVSKEDAQRYAEAGVDQLILPIAAGRIERFAAAADEAAELVGAY